MPVIPLNVNNEVNLIDNRAAKNIWSTSRDSLHDLSRKLPVAYWSKRNNPPARQVRLKVAQKLAGGESLSYALSSSSFKIESKPRDYNMQNFENVNFNLSPADLEVYRGVVGNKIESSNLIESIDKIMNSTGGDRHVNAVDKVPSIEEFDKSMKDLENGRRQLSLPKYVKSAFQGGKSKVTQLLLGSTAAKKQKARESQVSWNDDAKTQVQKNAASSAVKSTKQAGGKKMGFSKIKDDKSGKDEGASGTIKSKLLTPVLKKRSIRKSSGLPSTSLRLKKSGSVKKGDEKKGNQISTNDKDEKVITEGAEASKVKTKKKKIGIGAIKIMKGKEQQNP